MSGSFVDCADLLSAFHMRGGGEGGITPRVTAVANAIP
jgi:CO/xanthine dehydrogenase Mo-binding subunit